MLLSICLPNRNQSSALEFSLKYILEQRIDLLEDIEIIISDNASSDDSSQVIFKYVRHLDVKTHFQESNVGFLGQLKFLSRQAEGDYILFLGAGDLIQVDSLKSILTTLKKKEDFSILTYEAAEPQVPSLPSYSDNSVSFVTNLQETKIPYFSPSISCNIFRRSNFLQALTEIPNLGHEWPHAQIALYFAKQGLQRGYTDQRILQVYPTDSGWSHTQFAFDVLIQYEEIMREFVANIPVSADLYLANIGLSKNKLNRIIALRILGVTPSKTQYLRMAKLYRKNSFNYFGYLIIGILPTVLLQFIKATVTLFRKSK